MGTQAGQGRQTHDRLQVGKKECILPNLAPLGAQPQLLDEVYGEAKLTGRTAPKAHQPR